MYATGCHSRSVVHRDFLQIHPASLFGTSSGSQRYEIKIGLVSAYPQTHQQFRCHRDAVWIQLPQKKIHGAFRQTSPKIMGKQVASLQLPSGTCCQEESSARGRRKLCVFSQFLWTQEFRKQLQLPSCQTDKLLCKRCLSNCCCRYSPGLYGAKETQTSARSRCRWLHDASWYLMCSPGNSWGRLSEATFLHMYSPSPGLCFTAESFSQTLWVAVKLHALVL